MWRYLPSRRRKVIFLVEHPGLAEIRWMVWARRLPADRQWEPAGRRIREPEHRPIHPVRLLERRWIQQQNRTADHNCPQTAVACTD